MLVIVACISSVALASTGVVDATLHFAGITINIDNNIVIPRDANGNIVDPFIIEGTTYLPVRAVSEALGKDVTWNSENYSVHISDSDKIAEVKSSSRASK